MSRPTLTLLAPAKLNLFLHVTGRRSDGYHELQTVFQLLDYGDLLHCSLSEHADFELHLDTRCLSQPVPLEANLIRKAHDCLRARAQRPLPGVRLALEKRLPAGGGLGGGSADAAMTLLALDRLWGLDLGTLELSRLGAQLGADVPLFIGGHSAWAEGIGERLQPLQLPPRWYVVITPSVAVSTAEIFCHEDLTRNTPAIKMADFLAGGVRNDCESVTCRLYPEVENSLNWLRQFADARMTGTGSSVFAAFEDEASARQILADLPDDWHGFVARGIDALPHAAPVEQ